MEGETIQNVIKYWMGGEIINFIKVWLSVYIFLCYCYVVGKVVPKGTKRLLILFPVICLFLILPLYLHSMHLGGMSGFFIAWLANFKLFMFAFGNGPLSDSSFSLLRFLAVACLPINTKQKPSHIKENPSLNNHSRDNSNPNNAYKKSHKSAMNYAIKALLLALFLKVYDYSEHIHPKIILLIYGWHMYFYMEIILTIVGALARTLFGIELEPQFDDPYLSTSLQEFWGRRWNLVVYRILRPAVYEPVLNMSTRIMGRRWAPLPSILGTFVVSGLMHELMFYYLGRMRSTGELTWFFLLHGVCLMAEIAMKKAFSGKWWWRLPRIISMALTIVFVMATSFWLFFPQLLRCEAVVKSNQEYAMVAEFMRDIGSALTFKSSKF